MPLQGHSTCAHCGALLSGPVCAICGKSVHDPVDVVEAAPVKPGLSAESRRQLMGFGVFIAVVAVLGAGLFWALTRTEAEPEPTALGLPETTTTVERPEVSDQPIVRPGSDAAPLPTLPATDSVEREVGEAVNPWNGAPPRNVLSGELLENTDYRPGIAAVAAIVDEPIAGFTVGAPVAAEWNGVDLTDAERSQPFAARGVADETGPIADIWVIARGQATNDGSAAYLAAAQALWPIDEPIDSFSPRPGIRIHQVASLGGEAVWVDDRGDWMVVYRASVDVDPALLGSISETWG